MSEILAILILLLLLLFLLGVSIVFFITYTPEILDAISNAKKAIDDYKRGNHE